MNKILIVLLVWGTAANAASDEARVAFMEGNYSKASVLLMKECNNGDAEAYTLLGRVYEKEQKFSKAVEYSEKGCRAGDMTGCYNAGVFYTIGHQGVEKNYSKAKKLLKKACERGQIDSCSFLGYVYQKTQDYSKAKKFYQKGCNGGDDLACKILKRM